MSSNTTCTLGDFDDRNNTLKRVATCLFDDLKKQLSAQVKDGLHEEYSVSIPLVYGFSDNERDEYKSTDRISGLVLNYLLNLIYENQDSLYNCYDYSVTHEYDIVNYYDPYQRCSDNYVGDYLYSTIEFYFEEKHNYSLFDFIGSTG